MGSVRHAVRRMLNQEPERAFMTRGFTPRRVGWGRWEYRNPALAERLAELREEAEIDLSGDTNMSPVDETGELDSTSQSGSQPDVAVQSLDDQGGQSRWTA